MEVKIVFTGPPNAGKTTAIAALSETPPVVTDVRNNDLGLDKSNTTVGLDYGVVSLGGGDQVRLYGTPGQKRFDFMWPILVRNALGVAILIDNSQPDAPDQLEYFLHVLENPLRRTACVIGIGRMDPRRRRSLDDYGAVVARRGFVFPVVPVDVRQRADVLMLVDLMLAQFEGQAALVRHD